MKLFHLILKPILTIIPCVFLINVYAQLNCNLRGYDKLNNVIYATNVWVLHPNTGNFIPPMPNNGMPTVTVKPKMTIYRPKLIAGEPSNKKFPLAIICHGSGTTRDAAKETSMAIDLAQKGILAICIDYRLDKNVILESHPLFPIFSNIALWTHLGTSAPSICDKSSATKS